MQNRKDRRNKVKRRILKRGLTIMNFRKNYNNPLKASKHFVIGNNSNDSSDNNKN